MTSQAQLATRPPSDRTPSARGARPLGVRATSPRFAPCLALALALAPASAAAQAGPEDRAAAESLFAEGRELLSAGEYRRACAKLEASQKLEPALGTSLNLADCYEKLGRTASAWAEFKGAAARAGASDALRKQTALARAAAIEPRLCRLALEAADPDVTVLQNGRPLSAAVLGSAIPIDPGSYHFEASAPGKLPWTTSVEIRGEGELRTLRIPALAPAPPGQPPPREPEPRPLTSEPNGQRALAWTLGAVGVASLATGAVFGVLASSSWSKAERSCADYPYDCTLAGIDHANTAGTRADVATAAFIVGAAALGTSVVLFALDPGSASAELALGTDRLALRGRF